MAIEQDDKQQHALRHHDDQRPNVVPRKIRAVIAPTPPPFWPRARRAIAEHSAITAEARAIGLVK